MVRKQFPDVFLPKPVQEADPFPDLTLTRSLASSLDDQTLIDALVFEAWRTADEARSIILGDELTSRRDAVQDSESDGILLMFDDEILDSDWGPEESGESLTKSKIEHCRAFAIQQHFGNPSGDWCWQVVPICSRTRNETYLAHILN